MKPAEVMNMIFNFVASGPDRELFSERLATYIRESDGEASNLEDRARRT